MAKSKKKMSTAAFDEKFETGEEIDEHLDWDTAIKKVNVDFPLWMVQDLDFEATRLQVPRQAVIKLWIDERLQQIRRERQGDDRQRKPAI